MIYCLVGLPQCGHHPVHLYSFLQSAGNFEPHLGQYQWVGCHHFPIGSKYAKQFKHLSSIQNTFTFLAFGVFFRFFAMAGGKYGYEPPPTATESRPINHLLFVRAVLAQPNGRIPPVEAAWGPFVPFLCSYSAMLRAGLALKNSTMSHKTAIF